MRKVTLKGIKRKADLIFSEYIRRLNSDSDGWCICITCGDIKPWKQQQNGHYFPRNRLGTRFHEDNCHVQCTACNVFKRGNYTAYAAYMYRKYGSAKVEHLEHLSRQALKLTIADYQTMIAGWKQMIAKMKP